MEKSKPTISGRKKLGKITLGVTLALVLLSLVSLVCSKVYQAILSDDSHENRHYVTPEEERQRIDYEPVDFEENIFEDEEYMARNRDIKFILGSQSSEVALDEEGGYYGEGLSFFQDYFACVIRGDYTSYPDFFSESYAENEANYPLPAEPFTMQKIYNISVEYRKGEDLIVSENEIKRYYIVKYMVFENNGTFRHDLPAETTVPLLVELSTIGDETRISNMVKYLG